MISHIERLNSLSLFEFPEYFSSLEAPRADALQGLYKGTFVGPTWLRGLAGPLLAITRMGMWMGKDIDAEGRAINLVRTEAGILQKFPMRLVEQDSLIDGKPGLALRYEASNPFPWPWIIDELRSIQPDLVLGMTITQIGPLVRLPLPFVLQPRESLDEI
jgi:hypothetical protein